MKSFSPTSFYSSPSVTNATSAKSEQNVLSYQSSTSPGKTILITNNYSQNGCGGAAGTAVDQIPASQRNSITIVTSKHPTTVAADAKTVVLDRINICINNHYDSGAAAVTTPKIQIKSEKMVKEVKEDAGETMKSAGSGVSTVKELQSLKFKISEDVLVQQNDGRFYLGTIVAIATNQCLVRFDDGTEKWAGLQELTKLNTSEAEPGPLCVVCKVTKQCELVEVCERCGRGYHRKCMEGDFVRNGVWFCRRCREPNGTSKSKMSSSLSATTLAKREGRKLFSPPAGKTPQRWNITDKSQLSYNIDRLTWDVFHHVNDEQIYCYCGKNGEWYVKMLQCCRCQQWFHEMCVSSIRFPLFHGDRFYIFVCSMCNHGSEFLRRLELSWTDLVHLLIYNLTIHKSTKYYDVPTVIVPFAQDIWHVLQLPEHMLKITPSELQDKILFTLKQNQQHFKCGREIKKRATLWGLRNRGPPAAPFVILPPNGPPVTESYIRHFWSEAKLSLQFVYANTDTIDSNINFKMTGLKYTEHSTQAAECEEVSNDSNCNILSDDDEIPKFIIEKNEIGQFSSCKTIESREPSSSISRETSSEKSRDAYDENSKDSSVDLPPKRHLRKRKATSSGYASSLMPVEKKRKEESPYDSSDDTSSRSTLDLIIPPPKNFQGANNPFSNQLRLERQPEKTLAGRNPLNFPPVRIVRTVRRKLSAKDIIIGPNQEVKRKKTRRRSSNNVEVIRTTTSFQSTLFPVAGSSSSSGSSTPLTPPNGFGVFANPFVRPGSMDNKGGILKKETSNTSASSGTFSLSLPTSPIKSDADNSLNDLRSSVHDFFSARERILRGEKFKIRGMRVLRSGQKQVWIEWENNTTVL